MNSSTITLKAKQFFNQNYGWILLITGIVALVFINGAECIRDYIIGFNEGLNGLPEGSLKENNKENIAYSFSSILLTLGAFLAFLIIFSLFIFVIGNFFYYLFFKYILQKSSPLYIIAFIVWLQVFYGLTWKLLAILFTKHHQEKDITPVTALTFMFIIAYVFIKNYVINTDRKSVV